MSTNLRKPDSINKSDGEKNISSLGLQPNIAAFLCYLGLWVSGIIFLVLEQKNREVRFHAAQSTVTFGFLMLVLALFNLIPQVGNYLAIVLSVLVLVLWLVLMINAYNEKTIRLPVAAGLAEWLARITVTQGKEAAADTRISVLRAIRATPQEGQTKTDIPVKVSDGEKTIAETRAQRTLSYCWNIFWSFAFLILLNFYSDYLALYSFQEPGSWFSYPLLTSAFALWLPLINMALVFTIAGNIVTIISDRYIIRETVQIIINLIFIPAVAQLLVLFPFNFASIPHEGLAQVISVIIRIILVLVVVVLVIKLLFRIARLIFRAVRGNID